MLEAVAASGTAADTAAAATLIDPHTQTQPPPASTLIDDEAGSFCLVEVLFYMCLFFHVFVFIRFSFSCRLSVVWPVLKTCRHLGGP